MAPQGPCSKSRIYEAAESRLDGLLPDRLTPNVVKLLMAKIRATRTSMAKVVWANIYAEVLTQLYKEPSLIVALEGELKLGQYSSKIEESFSS